MEVVELGVVVVVVVVGGGFKNVMVEDEEREPNNLADIDLMLTSSYLLRLPDPSKVMNGK